MMHTSPTVLIIGAGFAGLSAYLVLRKRHPHISILMIDQRAEFSYIPAFHHCLGNAGYLPSIQFNYADIYGSDVIQDEVMSINHHTVTTKLGHIYTPTYIIIATGSSTKILPDAKKNIHTCRYAEDILAINAALPSSKNIVVVGGGYTGVEIASALAEQYPDKHIRLIHSHERLLNYYSTYISDMSSMRLQNRGVSLMLQCKVVGVSQDTITLSDGHIYESDLTIFSTGVEVDDSIYRESLSFETYREKKSEHIYICGDLAIDGLDTTAHNAMIEGRRIGYLIADSISGVTKKTYRPLKNWTILALALGTRDGMITFGKKGISIPRILGWCKRVIEKRIMFEFTRKIMLWI